MFSIQGFLTCQSKLLMNYKHLSQVERYQIYALMKAGHDQTQIAKLLDRHKSTNSRELSRNCELKGYRPKQACELTAKRSEQSRNAASVPAWVCEQATYLLCLQWERGSNENFNGLLRQYVPKKRSMNTVDEEEITMIQNRLNNRPRKRLGFKTLSELFHQSLKPVVLRT